MNAMRPAIKKSVPPLLELGNPRTRIRDTLHTKAYKIGIFITNQKAFIFLHFERTAIDLFD